MTVIKKRSLLSLLGNIGILLIALVWTTKTNASVSNAQGQTTALGFQESSQMLWKGNKQTLQKSSDAGRTWSPVTLPALPSKSTITGITFPQKSGDALYIAGFGMGVWHSSDAGRSWTNRSKGLPSKNVVALTSHATLPETVYAYVKDKGIFKSDDTGTNWQLMDRGPKPPISFFIHSDMPGSMQTGWLFAATSKGVKRSMDCFCGWHDAGSLSGKFVATAFDRRESKRVYAATETGVYRSESGGEEWVKLSAPSNKISAMAASASGTLFIVASGQIFQSRDMGGTWERTDA